MCFSGQSLCSGRDRVQSNASSNGSCCSGSTYAFCALGVGLVALGVVMVLWSAVPLGAQSNKTDMDADGDDETKQKTSSVAFVLLGTGTALLLLSVCLGIRNRYKGNTRPSTPTTSQYRDQVPGEAEETLAPAPNYDVPSYDEAVTSGRYPVRQSNLRQSTTHLPSYEDLIAAVENEGEGPGAPNSQNASSGTNADPPVSGTNARTDRSSSRASSIFRPLRVRRIKSEKLHVKDIRLNIQNPPQERQLTIEPLTPPPQYDGKAPEFPTDPK